MICIKIHKSFKLFHYLKFQNPKRHGQARGPCLHTRMDRQFDHGSCGHSIQKCTISKNQRFSSSDLVSGFSKNPSLTRRQLHSPRWQPASASTQRASSNTQLSFWLNSGLPLGQVGNRCPPPPMAHTTAVGQVRMGSARTNPLRHARRQSALRRLNTKKSFFVCAKTAAFISALRCISLLALVSMCSSHGNK